MQDDITKLKEEIDRCKAIIDILLKENKQLKQQIADDTAHDGQLRTETADDTTHDRQFRTKIADDTAHDRQLRTKIADDIAHDGQLRTKTADDTTHDGQFWIDFDVLSSHLKKEAPKSKQQGLINMCRILQLLYTKSHNTHKHIASVAKMTESGVSKILRMLKKRGLIVGAGFQEYKLTTKALGILNRCIKKQD